MKKYLLLCCAPSLWAAPCGIMDSAARSLATEDLLQAMDQYEMALDSCPEYELPIRTQLQDLYLELDLKEEAQINALLIKDLDSNVQLNLTPPLAQAHASEPPAVEGQGFYGTWTLGHQQWKMDRYSDTLDLRQSYSTLKLGYEWAWGDFIHDLNVSLGLSLDRDGTVQAKGWSRLGTLSKSPSLDYNLSYGSWSLDLGLERSVSGLSLLNAKSRGQAATTSADTTLSQNLSLNYDWISSPSSWWRASMNWEQFVGQSKDLSWMLYHRHTWNDWSLSGSLNLGSSDALYSLDYPAVHKISNILALGKTWQSAQSYFQTLPDQSSSRQGQYYAQLALEPKYQLSPSLAVGVGTRLSFDVEKSKEIYYMQNGALYVWDSTSAVVEGPLRTAFVYTTDGVDLQISSIDKYSHLPAWLNLYTRPFVKWKASSSLTLNAWYSYAADLWREDYVLYPQGEAGAGYQSQAWGVNAVLGF